MMNPDLVLFGWIVNRDHGWKPTVEFRDPPMRSYLSRLPTSDRSA
jgi:hypothetical protein